MDHEVGPVVVIGLDGRADSARILGVGAELAARLGGSLQVVHAVTLADYGIDPDTEEFEAERDRRLAALRALVSAELADRDLAWSYRELVGDPATRLAEVAQQQDASVIVVAADHGGLLHHLVSGHVVTALTHRQERPVLVVPPRGDSRGEDR